MDKGLSVPKWVLKLPQMPQNSSAQTVCPRAKVLDFNKKRLHWGSVVRGSHDVKNVNDRLYVLQVAKCYVGYNSFGPQQVRLFFSKITLFVCTYVL